MPLEIFEKPCKNCLFSKDAIVSPKIVNEILLRCVQNDTHFECHEATMKNKKTVCSTFYTKLGNNSRHVRFAKQFSLLRFVPQKDHEMLPTYKQMNQ